MWYEHESQLFIVIQEKQVRQSLPSQNKGTDQGNSKCRIPELQTELNVRKQLPNLRQGGSVYMWFVNPVSSRELLGFPFVLRCGRNVESTGRRPGSLIGASAGPAMDSHVTCKLHVKDNKQGAGSDDSHCILHSSS